MIINMTCRVNGTGLTGKGKVSTAPTAVRAAKKAERTIRRVECRMAAVSPDEGDEEGKEGEGEISAAFLSVSISAIFHFHL